MDRQLSNPVSSIGLPRSLTRYVPSGGADSSPRVRTVFLAEDDFELRRALADILRNAGYHVQTAASGRELLHMLHAAQQGELSTPDALVVDIRMPNGTGLDVLAAGSATHAGIPIVMITGFGDPVLRETATRRGATVVLDKPFEAEDLLGVLRSVLRLYGRTPRLVAQDEREPDTQRRPHVGSCDE